MAHTQRLQYAKRLQLLLGSVFLVLGAWCLVTPHSVEQFVLRPEYQVLNATSALLMGCFGAQAVLVGSVVSLSTFSARTFLVFGLVASVPFFVFNYYFYYVVQMFTPWMLLDFVGNAVIFACGMGGWQLLRKR